MKKMNFCLIFDPFSEDFGPLIGVLCGKIDLNIKKVKSGS